MAHRRSISMAIAVTLVFAFGTPTWAQSMGASVYSDFGPGAWGGELWVDSWATAESSSGECEHSFFQTTAAVISPTGRSYSNTYSQMSSAASLQVQEEEGDWEITSLLEFDCSCDGGVAVSFGTMVPATNHVTFYRSPFWLQGPPPSCTFVNGACTSGTVVCGSVPHVVVGWYACPGFAKAYTTRMWIPGWGFQCSPSIDHWAPEGGACF
jgi:hypothetical protein